MLRGSQRTDHAESSHHVVESSRSPSHHVVRVTPPARRRGVLPLISPGLCISHPLHPIIVSSKENIHHEMDVHSTRVSVTAVYLNLIHHKSLRKASRRRFEYRMTAFGFYISMSNIEVNMAGVMGLMFDKHTTLCV